METDNNLILELASDPVLIGEWTFYPDILQLKCGDKNIKLEPRVAYLLFFLAKNVDSPVSRDNLMGKVWPNMVVGDEALTGAINKLRKALGDDSHSPQYIETIPKLGYRLVANVKSLEPIQEASVSGGSPHQPTFSSGSDLLIRKRFPLWLTSIFILTAFVLLIFVWPDKTEIIEASGNFDIPDKPSIAISVFNNLSNDETKDYFVVGMTEDIITDLSKVSGLRVIALRDEAPKRQDLVQKHNIRYLLAGSVRNLADRVRINVRLVDNEDGSNVWAERYDRKLEDVFILQEEIAQQVVGALSLTLTGEEQNQLSRSQTASFDAYDAFLQGQRHTRNVTRESNLAAQQLFERAIELDSGFARAYGALSVNYAVAFRRGWTEYPDKTLGLAVVNAEKAAALDNTSPHILWALGYSYLFKKEYQKAIDALEKAIHIAPSYADGYGLLALINNNLGRYEQAAEQIRKAMVINPVYTYEYPYLLGWALYGAERYEEAIETLAKAIERNESALAPHLFLAASYVGLNQQDDAEWEIEQILVHEPEYTTSKYNSMSRMASEDELNRFLDDLRKAGLPD